MPPGVAICIMAHLLSVWLPGNKCVKIDLDSIASEMYACEQALAPSMMLAV